MSGEFVSVSRELWETAVRGLDSDDPTIRRSAFHRVLATAPPTWDVDLDEAPGEQQ